MGDSMLFEARLIKGDGIIVGIEFQENDIIHFVSFRQDLWPGLRVGKFPCRSDGTEWERETVRVLGWGDQAPVLEIGAWDTGLNPHPYFRMHGREYPVILSRDMPIGKLEFVDADGNVVVVAVGGE